MKTNIIIALVAFTLGQNLFAYPTRDGVSFGYGAFGYHWSFVGRIDLPTIEG